MQNAPENNLYDHVVIRFTCYVLDEQIDNLILFYSMVSQLVIWRSLEVTNTPDKTVSFHRLILLVVINHDVKHTGLQCIYKCAMKPVLTVKT